MSAIFILKFRGVPMRREGVALVTCSEAEATQFPSEAEALLIAHQHLLQPEYVEVEPLN